MIQIKKTILTLVALLAVTTGAWADGIVCTASDLGKVLCTDGSIYENVSAATTAGKEAAAMIAYVDETNKNGLALALTDINFLTWDNTGTSNGGKTAPELCSAWNTSKAVTGGTWKLATKDEWDNMISAAGSHTDLCEGFSSVGGTNMETDDYWSSTEFDSNRAWAYGFRNGEWYDGGKDFERCVRACLAFDIASSGPEVAWDKATKTGTFTMPAGNVTLEPEYYPQATVADGGVTAADADARATTDDPLVKVDATKLTGAKKLMYFVSNSGTTAPAYDAEGWTDQLPNAEGFTQQGIVYVWYYPVGIDEGVDDATATYSDGDICLQSITARIADAPTYAVTFAEGTDPNEWTADPAADVKKGQTVTVTYTGSKKVIGVKAEKKSAAPASNPLDNTTTAWSAGTFVVPAGGLTYSDAITVSGDVTLTLTDGETLTLNKGISLAEGATLTVEGNGTMNVNGSNGNTSSTVAGTGMLVLTSGTLTATGGNGGSVGDDSDQSHGGNGGVAINGSVIVSDGTLTARGGNGGSVGNDCWDCTAGKGGDAISGTLTINGGSTSVNNGSNGSIGIDGEGNTAGKGGKAVAGTVTDNR